MKITELYKDLVNGDRVALSKAITLLESSKPQHRVLAEELLSHCSIKKKEIPRIAVTGPPGAGKSSLIESLGIHLIAQGMKLAVLTVDPSSSITKGSILGDQTRMEELSKSSQAYIRQSPTSNKLGGVGPRTREAVLICEQAGFDVVFIETVGVGQSEFDVSQLTDLVLLLAQPGSGDELQGVKKGILEMADVIAVNKADGGSKKAAEMTARQLKTALHIAPKNGGIGKRSVFLISAVEKVGLQALWDELGKTFRQGVHDGLIQERRADQMRLWADELLHEGWLKKMKQKQAFRDRWENQNNDIFTPKTVLKWVKGTLNEM